MIAQIFSADGRCVFRQPRSDREGRFSRQRCVRPFRKLSNRSSFLAHPERDQAPPTRRAAMTPTQQCFREPGCPDSTPLPPGANGRYRAAEIAHGRLQPQGRPIWRARALRLAIQAPRHRNRRVSLLLPDYARKACRESPGTNRHEGYFDDSIEQRSPCHTCGRYD